MISGIAASVALALAAPGVHGVIAFMVTARTREIGVRVALGGIYTVAATVAFLVALLAGVPSARRVSTVQPIIAMRAEQAAGGRSLGEGTD